ncbi:MAG: threonine-phosphate decarboxylase [Lachnospiraceae bacterium]|jgi:threonine-phosphate decarboxylase|nr:threonine-phosphate decarboxylase [Lachnospiraceae bacterium]
MKRKIRAHSFPCLHGGDRYGAAMVSGWSQEDLLDFSANVNPFGMPSGVREAVIAGLEQSLHYPDPLCRQLRMAIGRKEGMDPEQILCGNGGADLIYRLVYACRPKKALVTAPSFAEYEEALSQIEAQICHWFLPEDMTIKADILEAVTEDLDLIFLCNPNNPTGLLTERETLLAVLEKAKTCCVRVCVDECFLDFVREQEDYTLKNFLDVYPNLILLKSFTKLYAIPGLRLGYVLSSDKELLKQMRAAGQPWAVSEPAQCGGMAALQATGFRERTIDLVDRERAFLKEELEKMGLLVYEGRANYLCFLAKGEKELYEKLLERGILIRRCRNYPGLTEEHYRVAVRGHEENQFLLEALKKIWKERDSK